jgi:hypothetical protein
MKTVIRAEQRSGDAFGSGGRYQACIHLQGPGGAPPLLLECW